MSILKDWKTSELVDFLNSYNRVHSTCPSDALPYRNLYVKVFTELNSRSPLLALIY